MEHRPHWGWRGAAAELERELKAPPILLLRGQNKRRETLPHLLKLALTTFGSSISVRDPHHYHAVPDAILSPGQEDVAMGPRQKWVPSPSERVYLQLGALALLCFFPLVLAGCIIYGLVSVSSAIFHCHNGMSDLKDALKDTGLFILIAVFFPFLQTLDNCAALARSLCGIPHISPFMWDDTDDGDSDIFVPYFAPERRRNFSPASYGAVTPQSAPYQSCSIQSVDQFRLLVVSPGSFDDPLRGALVTNNLSNPSQPLYDALSYTWADETGNADRKHTLALEEGGGSIPVTKNCDAAIRRLRHPHQKRSVWIDAICINQSNVEERTSQVSIMSKIYTTARSVVVYLGEGTPQTDKLFDWLNRLKTTELNIPSSGNPSSLGEDIATKMEWYWNTSRENLASLIPRNEAGTKDTDMSESELIDLAGGLFSRRWFSRVWVLQEVSLPDPRSTTVICGAKSISATRTLHLLSLLRDHAAAHMVRIFVLVRSRPRGGEMSHLLDILIETRSREAADPRDKIFGVLSIAALLDGERFPRHLGSNYGMTTQEVYKRYSFFFIKHHGAGFFLSLIKSRPNLTGLPSWAADWTVPWPNYKAVMGRDLAATTRAPNNNDREAVGTGILTKLVLHRKRILRGYFTKTGHIDDLDEMSFRTVESLEENQVLFEMYPGVAALLMRIEQTNCYAFIQTCPHALSEAGVEELVARWSSVVVDGEGPKDQAEEGSGTGEYLGPAETFTIQ